MNKGKKARRPTGKGWMGLNLRKLWSNYSWRQLKGTTWQRVLVGVVYFLLFTIVLSSNLFVSKVHIKAGEPSPELIKAPWAKDIEDLEKYHQDQEDAAKAIQPVYKPDEDFDSGLARDLSKAFLDLHDIVSSNQDERTKISKLKQIAPFTSVPDSALAALVKTAPGDLSVQEPVASEIIVGRARNLETGARSTTEVPALQERMKQDISQANLPDATKAFLQTFVETKVNRPTLVMNEQGTEKLRNAAKAAVKLEVHRYIANQKIIGPGEIADDLTIRVLAAYGLIDNRTPWRAAGGVALVVLCGMAVIFLYVYQNKRAMEELANKLILVGLTISLVLAIGKGITAINLGGSEYNSLSGMLVPVAWATMSVAILVDVELALLVSVILAVFVTVLVDPSLTSSFSTQVGLVALFGGIIGVHSVSHLSQRSDLARAGLFVSAVNVISIGGIALMSGMRLTVWAVGVLLGIVNGLASSVLTVGTLHWLESGFHITSGVRLLELSNPNRPLLKRLLMEAPGTYHHSILVGNLAEAAAEAVKADATMVRVGSMYHDIGKLKRPYFFIENQFAQDNPHDKIAPTLSSLIITSHIKDGLELAKENKLPQPIQDIIVQHHGDSLVSFFYHKAKEENEDMPEEAFHYDAPRPQSKEAALVCLADSVEAAVRSMKQPTPGRIEGLVRKIIKDKLNDGQLDQCDLTFRDLDRIAMSFVRVLSGIFHSRVEYPELPNTRAGGQQNNPVEENAAEQRNVKTQADGTAGSPKERIATEVGQPKESGGNELNS